MTMNHDHASILCPGPSLAKVDWGTVRDTLIVTVNRAVLYLELDVDWWAVHDQTAFYAIRDKIPQGTIREGLMTSQLVFDQNRDRPEFAGHEGGKVLIGEHDCPDSDFHGKTAPMAAWLTLGVLKIPHVTVYGCDLRGGADWDMKQLPNVRTEQRWAEEMVVWRRLIDHYGAERLNIVGNPLEIPVG